MLLSRSRLALALFASFLVLVILAANTGTGAPIFHLVHEIPYGDKIGHFFLMGMLSFLANLSLGGRMLEFRGRRMMLMGSAIVLVIVTLEELSQHFIPNRTLDGGDLIADYAGILLFGKLAMLMLRAGRRRTAAAT